MTRFVSSAPASRPSSPSAAVPTPPIMIYGTAWKKERTRELVLQALRMGYRAIDTACQPKHYQEELVGAGIADAEAAGVVTRSDVYLQTKYTPIGGQDPADVPYDPSAPLEEQVKQSVATSLRNLRTEYIDCLLVHSPLATHAETMRVWRQLERHVGAGEVRSLGISNCYDVKALAKLHEEATVKPVAVQNRFYEATKHDVELRKFCAAHGIAYQSFWTLTGNKQLVQGSAVRGVARAHGCTPEQVWLGFVRALGITPLSGTTSAEHMADDLALPSLRDAEVQKLNWLISTDGV